MSAVEPLGVQETLFQENVSERHLGARDVIEPLPVVDVDHGHGGEQREKHA